MKIRVVQETDASAIAAIYRPSVIESPVSFETEAPDADEVCRRIRNTLIRRPWLVCADGERVTGFAYAAAHRERPAYQWSVEVSAYVHESARRLGIARGLYTSLLAVLELQGFRNAYAGITLPNEASVSFHEALGFEPIGVYRKIGYKSGAWRDVGWWQRELANLGKEPAPPIDFVHLRGADECKAAISSGERFVAQRM